MYENKTFETIMEEMLDNVPNDVDKREGSIIYDALSPVAMELAQVYIDLDMLIDETFADSASYYYLIKRAAEHGIFVQEGTLAVLEVVVSPVELQIEMGTKFDIGELNYTITGSLDEGHYLLTCDTPGAEGNNTTDEVIPVDYIEDLESVEIYGIYTAGTDDEDEESLRERYIESFSAVAFGGNKADYKEKIKSIPGVGGCKVYSAKDLNLEAGKVKCVILDSGYACANQNLVKQVQNIIDPTQDGSGNGLAPCGHTVTITSADSIALVVGVQAELASTWDNIKITMEEKISEYLLSLSKEWDEKNTILIRKSKIESILLDIDGVEDVYNVTIMGSANNYTVDKDSIPVLGELINNG